MTHENKNRKNIFARLIIGALAVYAVVVLVEMQVELTQRRQELSELQDRVEAEYVNNKELKRRLNEGVEQDEIERVAREKLDYVLPDEIVFVDISGN